MSLPDSIVQVPNGWRWLDETWNYGDEIVYPTREEASAAQKRYIDEVLEGPVS